MNTIRVRNASLVLFALVVIYAGSQQASASVYCDDYYIGVTHVWECPVEEEVNLYSCNPYFENDCHAAAQSFCEAVAGSYAASGWWQYYPESFTWIQEVGWMITYGEIRCELAEG